MFNLIDECPKKDYAEIYQQTKMQFAVCYREGDDIYKYSDWVKCRDFLTDIPWSIVHKKTVSIYGFTYDPKTIPYNTDKIRYLLKDNNKDEFKNIIDNLHLLNKIEEKNGFEKSILTQIEDDVWMIEGDIIWTESSFTVSLYTFFIKCLCYKHKDNNLFSNLGTTNESTYYEQVKTSLTPILYRLREVFEQTTTPSGRINEEEDKEISQGNLHNNSGIVAVLKVLPDWSCYSKIILDIKKEAA